ncbi:MAG: NnrU family protein [Nitratireductor sp.]|nr:NnrU family protein [Nitratireductor sp.]
MTVLIIGIVLFLGTHSIRMIAPGWREARIAALGEGPWKGLYSIVSLVGLVLIIWGYGLARPGAPDLYYPPAGMAHLAILLMAIAFVALAVSQFPAGRLKPILKHPMLLSVKVWAFAHLLVNGDLASLLLFGSLLAWAVMDRISVKRRGAPVPAPGPVVWDVAAVVTGFALWALFIWKAHEWLFGVAIPMGA